MHRLIPLAVLALVAARLAAYSGQDASRADLDYAHPPANSDGGLPIGNGRMGSLVWTDPSALRLQINRVDVFAVSGSSRSFPQRDTEYCDGCAGVEVDVGPGAAFPDEGTTEHLACSDGVATIRGSGVEVRALAWADGDVIAIELRDLRPEPETIRARLRMLRPAFVRTRFHTARSTLSTEADGTVLLHQDFAEGSYYCGSAVAERTVADPARHVTWIFLSSAAGFQRDGIDARVRRALAAGMERGFQGLVQANDVWWRRFWSRSNIRLHSADGVADRVEADYAYYLYLMGCTSRGAYPTKFNGMLWNTEGDVRRWGSAYWGANQSCYYNDALFAANHGELMEPMFAMYTAMAPAEERAAREEWGAQGIYFPETVTFDGLAALPPDLAREMPQLYLLRKPWAARSQEFRDYAADMQPYVSRWNFINGGHWVDGRWMYTERGYGPFGPTSHTLARGAKIAYQYWQRYEYTMDRDWLRDRAYPILKGVAGLYRTFPNTQLGPDGLWHIHYVNSNESLFGGRDTDEELAGIQGVFAALIRASEILGVDSGPRAEWREFLAHLAPLPRNDLPDVFDPLPAAAGRVWQRSFLPVVLGRPGSTLPDQNTLPVWFFENCTLESPPAMLRLANATLDAELHGRWGRYGPGARDAGGTAPHMSNGAPPRRRTGGANRFGVLSKMPLAGVELGRVEATREWLPAQMFGGPSGVLENRMDLREGRQTMGVERIGDAADALHTALVADLPGTAAGPTVIRLFPAWPKEWDAEFTLLCRGDFLVTAEQRAGVIGPVRIVAQAGGELRIRNPWEAAEIVRGAKVERSAERLLRIETAPGETVELRVAP